MDPLRPAAGGCLLRVWLLAMVMAPSLSALNPHLSLDQYLHTSWTQKEGSALPPIETLAQTADGYLWLGTATGLMRFDGMRFTDGPPAAIPSLTNSPVSCLLSASGGGLWVGTAPGLCRVNHDRAVRQPAVEKLPCATIASMLEDRMGRLWMLNTCANATTLAVLSPDGTMRTFGTSDGVPGGRLQSLFQDRLGNLGIVTDGAICRWVPGSPATCSNGPAFHVTAIAECGNGELAIADGDRKQVFRFSNGQTLPVGRPIPDSAFTRAMVCDRDNNIWIGTVGQGLLRLREDRVDRFTNNEGLSNNLVNGLMEDHEGDLWVATARGIDRIRDPKVQIYSTRHGLSSDVIDAAYGAPDGTVWVGTASGINRLAEGVVTRYSLAAGLPNPMVISLYPDSAGKLWAGTGAGLAVLTGDRFAEVLTADGQHLKGVFNLGGDRAGTVWLADSGQGLFTVRGGVARPMPVSGSDTKDIYGLLVARNGDVWLGHYHGGITVLSQGSAKEYQSRDGLAGGHVRALYEDREGSVWAGTGDGLSRFRDASWTTWTTAQGLPEGGVQSIVDDETGGLWLLTPVGVIRVPRASLDGPVRSLPAVLYGPTEGLRISDSMTNPRLTRSRDGRLWICTEDGVAAIDPSRLKSNPVPPPVVIEQVIADGKTYDSDAAAFRGHDLQISYTGISLMAPERVRFRYRLEGLSPEWTEAGTRRNVAYMHLSPGPYSFQVIASNNDGLWNTVGASVALRVDPYFYQTAWFLALCGLSTAMLVWSAYQLRMRRLVSRLQLIAAERVRFSRELHDSLLQGFSGVLFLLEAAARRFETDPEVSQQSLGRAIEQADRSLREAREMIASMRIPALEHSTLPEALRAMTAQVLAGFPVDFQFDIKGHPHQGPYDMEANLFVLAREAVTNALNHAGANRIRLELCYTPKELRLTIQDDGKGFDPEMAMAKAGHYGFRGMRERARQIGSVLTVNTAPGRGTIIDVAVAWKKTAPGSGMR